MTFNRRAAAIENRLRVGVASRLMQPSWLRYQLLRSRLAYLPAYRRSTSRKPLSRCLAEALLLGLRWRCLPFHYLRYGLYDQQYRLRDVLGYLPETVFYYRLLPARNRDTVLLDDKLVCKRLLGDAGVPQARLLLSGDAKGCWDSTGTPIEPTLPCALDQLLKDGQQVVVKPARFSSGGDGVLVLTYQDGALRDVAGQPVSLPRYGVAWGPWLAEEFVQQHAELATLHPYSLNTFRVITTWHPHHGGQVRYCVLKLGAGTGCVDNAHDGGLYLRINTRTGELADTAFDETFTPHRRHPVSGVVFGSYRISLIGEVVALAERCAALFPQTTLVGWDIAVSKDGPCVIEGNSSPGLTNVQRTHGGVARSLGRFLAQESVAR